jgi:hypothetical protein
MEPNVTEDDAGLPSVVFDEAHRRFVPLALAALPPEERGVYGIMSVGEDVRLDREGLPDDGFRSKPAAIDLRTDSFDCKTLLGEFLEPGETR